MGSAPSWTFAAVDYGSTTVQITGLDDAQSYAVRVRARNDGGNSAWTTWDPALPQAPDAVASSNLTHNGNNLSASWNSPNGAATYAVERQTEGGTEWTSAASDHATASREIAGADHAAAYTVRVKAKDAGGESAWTALALVRPPSASDAVAHVYVITSATAASCSGERSEGADGYDVACRTNEHGMDISRVENSRASSRVSTR